MVKFLQEGKVIVCVGSGGVGKTTVAAALGMLGAQAGKKVLVLTVDPSQRLKTTLGLDSDGEIRQIQDPNLKGELWAGVIQPKKTFDEFVRRAAQRDEVANKILQNKLYIQLSTTLSGSQEFTAMEKLYSAYESNQYDLIILDTPPTKHAIDFLKSPEKLSLLFNEKVASWFRDPEAKDRGFLSGILHAGTKQVLKILETLTGSDFIHELRDFFENIKNWQSQLESRTAAVHNLLVDSKTLFCLVSSFDEAKLKEAEYFGREIKKGGYHLSAIIINRAYPEWLKPQISKNVKTSFAPANEMEKLYNSMVEYYSEKNELYDNFASKMRARCEVLKLVELDVDIADIQGVQKMASIMNSAEETK